MSKWEEKGLKTTVFLATDKSVWRPCTSVHKNRMPLNLKPLLLSASAPGLVSLWVGLALELAMATPMTTTFTVTFAPYDKKNGRQLYFKTDGKRFNEERTVKLSCDVKYDLNITIKPIIPQLSLQ